MDKIREALEKWQAGPEKEFKFALDFAEGYIGNRKASEMDVGTLVGFYGGFEAKEAETCEWKHVKDFFHDFYISGCCGTQEFRNSIAGQPYMYCPFCGGKIVEKENEG